MPGAPSGRLEQTANTRVLDCKHPALSGMPIRHTHGDGGRVSSRQVRGRNTSEHAIYRGRGVLGDDHRMVRLLHFVTLGFILTPLFFKLTADPAVNFLAFLATYASGFAVRPFGAIVFGRIGDLVGRKYAFLLTVTIMGLVTAAIAFIPVYDQIGILA